jgi:hypothetical protein
MIYNSVLGDRKSLPLAVAVCVYSSGNFFAPELHQAGIPLIEISPSGYWQKFSLVYGWLRKWKPHVLQAFLPGPNILAELTTLLPHSWKVVVSAGAMGWNKNAHRSPPSPT